MAVVTEYLVQQIAKQVDENGLVVWYDPEGAYAEVAAALVLPNTTVASYTGSFFQLRHEIDSLMNGEQPPRLVVYVPKAPADTHDALIELEAAGVVMRPGQQPPSRNTKLAVVARNALRPLLGEDQVEQIERQVEAGKLSLADLNALAARSKDLSTGALVLIFGTANPQEVGLAFLHDDQHDAKIKKKEAEKELRHLLQVSFDIELPASEALSNWRVKLGRHVLVTDLFAALKNDAPLSLSSVSVAHSTGGVEACVRLARTWRNSREHRDSYVAVAKKIEQEFGLSRLEFSINALKENETFLCVEQALLAHVEEALLRTATDELLELARLRGSRFWAEVEPKIQARWALVAAAAEVLLEADRVAKELKRPPAQLADLVKAYADNPEPWCQLDTYHRHLESRKFHFEFDAGGEHQCLEKLIIKAEQRYIEVGNELAGHFVGCFAKAKHPVPGVLRQRDIFEKQVKPRLGEGKVGYIWVDALRFEMGRELARLLQDDFEPQLQPALGTIPTITEIGMAALLPKAHESIRVVRVGDGKLGFEIAGRILKDRKDRVAFLKEHAGVPVYDCKLDDLLPKPSKKVKDGIQNASLILVTSQEIDELGEADNTSQARSQIDGVLSFLLRGIRVLADHGIKTIVLAADHGHLFVDEIGDDMKIEAPGGDTADLRRRVWVGVGGTSESSYLRTSLRALGIESDLDLATPWTFAVFKSKGGTRAYFHGGLLPQEVIIPVLTLMASAKPAPAKTDIAWKLIPGTAKLTTRFFSVQVAGEQSPSSLFVFEPPKVRVEIRANKKVVSTAVSASYGFEDATGEVNLRMSTQHPNQIEPNTITLMVNEDVSHKTVRIHLLDATTGVELAQPLTVEVAISM
ncbi:MAG: PglZ domain-containing protein [Planctomycetaceae bacterium]|nr:MAG: PglZ domain-containing protein [Planctomycetaceae bacterium]